MEDIKAMLDRLPELSETELSDLEEKIIQTFGTVEAQEISRESVAEMTFLADSAGTVRAELAKRESEKTELAAQAAEAANRISSEAPADEAAVEEESPADPPENFSEAEAVVADGAKAEAEAEALATEETEELAVEPVAEEAEEVEESAEETEELAVEPVAEVAEATEELGAKDEEEIPPETEEDPAEEEIPLEEEKEKEPIFAAENADETSPSDNGADASTATLAVEETQTDMSAEAPMGNNAAEPTFSAPADRLPVARSGATPAPVAMVAGGDIPGVTAGSPLTDRLDLADAMSKRIHSLRRASGGTGEQVVVASLIAKFPEERTLRGNELDSNNAKIKAVTSPKAILASGGWCAPLPVNYDIFDIGGSTDTPIKDSLPVFNADRGGVRYIVPPQFLDYQGALGIWTNQDDIDAAPPATAPRKPCLTVQCAGEVEEYLDAITMCLCFGNLQTRAFPELIATHNELALVMAARYEELYVLNKIKTASTQLTLPAVLGTVRDVLISVERAATSYRNQFRLDPALALDFIAPQWLHAMIRSDLTAQLPGDGMDTTFNVSNSTIDNFFNERNIRPVWALEGLGAQPTPTDYPDTVEWALFSEGTFTLLDGGTLDIGIVRDMNLVSSNDYCMFTEQFLGVAKTGIESLWVTQSLNVNGGSAGTLDVAAVDY